MTEPSNASNGIPVEWSIATDERMSRVVKKGRAIAPPNLGHSVHVEVRGLEPARWYWYQFKTGAHVSAVGRTKTAPDARKVVDKLSFAFASCQHYETGYFTAYEHMAKEDIDLIVHLGDYIYEGGPRTGRPRLHDGPEPSTLERVSRPVCALPIRSGFTKSSRAVSLDRDLGRSRSREQLRQRQGGRWSAARSSSWSVAPMRIRPTTSTCRCARSSLPHGSSLRLYRRLTFGDLAEFSVLDTRQYRSDQPCGDGNKPQCEDALKPSQTMMGVEQERWFYDGLIGRAHAGMSLRNR